MYYTTLTIFGEGGTMASECACSTPSIYINSLPLMGYLKEAKIIIFYTI